VRDFRLHTRERSMMRSRRRIVVDVAGQTRRAIRRMSPRAPIPRDVSSASTTTRRCDARWIGANRVGFRMVFLVRSFVRRNVASRRTARSRVVRGRARSCAVVVPPNLKARHRANGMGAREMVLTGGVLIIVYGTCATNRMSCPSRVLNTQVT